MKNPFRVRLVCVALALSAGALSIGCSASQADEVSAGTSAATSNPITLENWEDHPALSEIQDLRSTVDVAAQEQIWTVARKENLCTGAVDESRMMMTDDSGHVRRLVIRRDIASRTDLLTATYDASGRLRFVSSSSRDDRGVGEQALVFMDTTGQKLWEVIQVWKLGADGESLALSARTPQPAGVDPFDSFSFDDPHFVDAPPRVFEREAVCEP